MESNASRPVMMATTRSQVLGLYRSLLKECGKLNQYNFRSYALEKTKYEFRRHKAESNPEAISALVQKAQENLDIVKRQVLIGHMYGDGHLVIEHGSARTKS